MSLYFCSFASGSSGNCYMIRSDETAILIDAGISGKKIFERLEASETPKEMVKALLVTHEHTDHVKSLPIVSKKIPGLKVYANEETWANVDRPVAKEQCETFITGEEFCVGDFVIRPFPVSHDAADPVGFSVYYKGKQISVCTDSGCIQDNIQEEIKGADLLLLEANHEKEMLLFGKYPYALKQRILGEEGHMSNVNCGECLCKIIEQNPKQRIVLLGHLSHENNTPEMALQGVLNTLEEKNIFPGGDLHIEVALRDVSSKLFEI